MVLWSWSGNCRFSVKVVLRQFARRVAAMQAAGEQSPWFWTAGAKRALFGYVV